MAGPKINPMVREDHHPVPPAEVSTAPRHATPAAHLLNGRFADSAKNSAVQLKTKNHPSLLDPSVTAPKRPASAPTIRQTNV